MFRNDLPLYVPMLMIMLSAYHMVGNALSLRQFFTDHTTTTLLFMMSNTNQFLLAYLIGITVADFIILMLGVMIAIYREKHISIKNDKVE